MEFALAIFSPRAFHPVSGVASCQAAEPVVVARRDGQPAVVAAVAPRDGQPAVVAAVARRDGQPAVAVVVVVVAAADVQPARPVGSVAAAALAAVLAVVVARAVVQAEVAVAVTPAVESAARRLAAEEPHPPERPALPDHDALRDAPLAVQAQAWQALSWLTAAPDVAAERWWVLAARRPAPDVAIPRVGLSPAALVAVSASSKARCLVPRAADAFRGALVRSC